MKLLTALLALVLFVGWSDPTGGGELLTEEYPNGNVKSEGYMDGEQVAPLPER